MNGRPIAFFQASCPSFPICTRFSMPGQPSSRQNLQIFHRRGAFQAFLCATPGARRYDAHAGALLYIYVKALTLRYGIWGTPRVIRNEKENKYAHSGQCRQHTDFDRSAAFLGVFLDKQWPCACPGASQIHQKGTYVGPDNFPCELVSVRGKNAVEMYGPAKLSRGTEAAARFISSIQKASLIPKKRIGPALGE